MSAARTPADRAARLLRWYPRPWRDRYDDPFYPGVQALARVLPKSAAVYFGNGCHTGPFFSAQEPPSLAFLARHVTGPAVT